MNQIKYLLSVISILLAMPVIAASPYIAGKDYTLLPSKIRNNSEVSAQIMKSPNKVQLLLFFSYGCGACARFEPSFDKWLHNKRDNKLVTYRMPVTFDQDEWQSLATLYFIMKSLDPKEKLSSKIFTAINRDRIQLWEESSMKQFFLANGYSAEKFTDAYNAFSNNAEAKKADKLSNAYGINRTPSIVINGPTDSYLLTVDKADNDMNKFFKILDYVIRTQEAKLKR